MKDLKKIHSKCMTKLHNLLGTTVLLKYHNDNNTYTVICTVAVDKQQLIVDGDFINSNKKEFRILKSYLIENNYKIKDFSSIIYNREEYIITEYYENTSIGNTFILKGEKNG